MYINGGYPFIIMNLDAVVSGILITFLGIMLLLERAGIVSAAALYVSAPFVLVVVGLLAIYVGLRGGQ